MKTNEKIQSKAIALYVICLAGIIFSIVWYTHLGGIAIHNISIEEHNTATYSLRILTLFGVPLICTILPKILTNRFIKTQDKNLYHTAEICLQFFYQFVYLVHIYLFVFLIGITLYKDNIDNVNNINNILSILFICLILVFLVRFFIKITGLSFSTCCKFILFITLLGYLDYQKISALGVIFTALNACISIDDRQKLFLFLKQKNIQNRFTINESDNKNLHPDEIRGKLVASQIILYIVIAIFYLTIIITQDINVSLSFLYLIQNTNINEYPLVIQYAFRGIDRFAVIIFFIYIFLSTSIVKLLFNPPYEKNKSTCHTKSPLNTSIESV